MLTLPKMHRVTQTFPRPRVDDLAAAAARELATLLPPSADLAGKKIAVTVGSRGIANLLPILRAAVARIRGLGAHPCVLAAMGSHGGGTEHGQRDVLDSLGITAEAVGAPVITCADCQTVAHTPGGLPVHTLSSALAVDAILLINRVKTHTSFKGPVESGLMKKLVVGLGGPAGARQFHSFGPAELPRLLQEIGAVLLDRLPVLGGLAIIENAYEETALLRAVPATALPAGEADLLAYAKSLMPALPVDDIDLLIIGEMGKNYSGTGIDTNIVGRARVHGVPEPARPRIKRIAVLDLSAASHGNATGVGLADFVTQRLVDKIDRDATYLNCLTSTFIMRAAIPMHFAPDTRLLDAALASLGAADPASLRVVVIPSTLFLEHCLVSPPIAAELAASPACRVAPDGEDLAFDDAGNLILPFPASS